MQKTTLIIVSALTFLSACASYQQQAHLPIAEKLIKAAQSSDAAYKIIESLTTEIGPRPAGSRQEKRAQKWAVKKMKNLGLQNIRIETFKVKHWERISESAKILSPFPQNLRITSLGGSVGTPKKGLSGQIVSFKSFEDLVKAPLKGFKNKIIFVDEPMARTKDGSGYSTAVVKRRKTTAEAAKRGALAALIRSVGTDHHRFPHTGQTAYEEGLKKVPIAALSAPDADQLRRALKMSDVTVQIKMQVRSKGDLESGNVIGEIPGETDQIVLAGAHLDSWDLGTGAVDDGAGVGIVLGAAKILLDHKVKPKHTIRIVLFGSEEVGLVGAKAYVELHKSNLKNHLVAAESDFGAGRVWKIDTSFSDQGMRFAKALRSALKPLKISKGHNQAYGGPDLTPMKKFGVPVVTLKQNGWDYFDLHHTEDDTFDKK